MNQKKTTSKPDRNGVTVVLFAILLPVLLLLAMVAINISHMQLTRTELKIATDAAARAGGRAWGEFNDLDQAKEFARAAAELNTVSGSPLILSTSDSAGEMVFGDSIRPGNARYVFTPLSESEILSGEVASGFQVNATHDTPLLFDINGLDSFTPNASSIATHADRDIALIVDHSGSMYLFEGQTTDIGEGEDFLFSELTDLFNDPANGITNAEYQRSINRFPTRTREYAPSIINLLSGDLRDYALTLNSDYRTDNAAPRRSRWHSLELAYGVFLDTLEETDPIELFSIISFANNAQLELPLTSNIAAARPALEGIVPRGSTAIGDGMLEGFAALNAPNARLSAVKTLIVMSDGINKAGINPITAATRIITENPNTVINTVTFSNEADLVAMAEVARIGSGKHFHAENTVQLIEVFRELAASHRTLITD